MEWESHPICVFLHPTRDSVKVEQRIGDNMSGSPLSANIPKYYYEALQGAKNMNFWNCFSHRV